eukprot:435464_1
MASTFILFVLCAVIINVHATPLCVFTDSAGSTEQLDLRTMKAKTLQQTDSLTNIYQFTPCKNGINLAVCNGTAMAVKLHSASDHQCLILAHWDAAAQAALPLYDGIRKRWTFNYSTGNECDGGVPYTFFAYFNCDPKVNDFVVVSAGTPRKCTGEMFIDTQYACVARTTTATPQNKESTTGGGGTFLIIILVGLSVYFVIGYIICAMRNRHRGVINSRNIPHHRFWKAFPVLVVAGCLFTKEFVSGLCCEKSRSDHTDQFARYPNDNEKINPFHTNFVTVSST